MFLPTKLQIANDSLIKNIFYEKSQRKKTERVCAYYNT